MMLRGSTNTGGESVPLPVMVLCANFGKTSESWMRRQTGMLGAVRPAVVCWNDLRAPEDRTGDPPVCSLDLSTTLPKTVWRRIQRHFNIGGASYFAAPAAEAARLRRLIHEVRPRSALVHFGHMGLRVLPALSAAKVPLVVHFHGADMSSALRSERYVRALRETIPEFAAIVVVARYMRDWLVHTGGADSAKVHLIPLGAPVEQIAFTERHGRGPCAFLAVGRLVRKKDPLATIRAFGEASKRLEGATLDVIGDGPLRAACEALVDELGLRQRVLIRGATHNRVVSERLAASDVFVQHSITDSSGEKEGWPVSIAEAMASGLPIVATRHAGIVDQVEEGVQGYLVNEGDIAAMAEAMVAVGRDVALRLRMGRAARARAMSAMSCTLQVERLERVLINAAEGR